MAGRRVGFYVGGVGSFLTGVALAARGPCDGNFAFMAMPTPAGRVEMDFGYRPTAPRVLVTVSWLTLAGTSVALIRDAGGRAAR